VVNAAGCTYGRSEFDKMYASGAGSDLDALGAVPEPGGVDIVLFGVWCLFTRRPD
jgi:hypothetical protein